MIFRLQCRQAQNYGVDVTESQLISNPFVPYGVYFNLSSNAESKAFVFL